MGQGQAMRMMIRVGGAILLCLALVACQGDTEPDLELVGAARVDAERAACERRGGKFVRAGNSARLICTTVPADAGKQCTKKSDCSSECLARSRTCAPVKPLTGCYDVLTEQGQSVQLCVN